MAFKSKIQVSRQRLEFFYSLLLIILIPALLVGNTLWLVGAMKDNFDAELRQKASLAASLIGTSVAPLLEKGSPDPAVLDSYIARLRAGEEDLSALSIMVRDGEGFRVVGSSRQGASGSRINDIQTQIVWSQDQPVAVMVDGETGRGWRILAPVHAASAPGRKVGLVSAEVSLGSAERLFVQTLHRSMLLLAGLVVVILLLLVNHFKFVEYAQLLRRQRELDRMKDDFISVATHELRAPITVIRGYLDGLLDGSMGKVDKAGRENVQAAFTQADRMAGLVRDLLDVSRLEQGRTKFNFAEVEVSPMVSGIVRAYGIRAKEKGLKLEYAPPASLPAVRADPARLEEVFTNLIDNAIKYSREGRVTVRHEVGRGELLTVISDTGIGMTAEEREHLFERFYRVKNADTATVTGTGLGLWIIKQYVEAMGGRITVDSMKGSGSSFTVSMPLAPATNKEPIGDGKKGSSATS